MVTVPAGFSKIIFLSHVLTTTTPVFPGDPPVQIKPAASIEPDGYYLQALACGEQSGTHWAAPAHFLAGAATADQLDPADFVLPAVVIDARAQAAADQDFALAAGDIGAWEGVHGRVPARAAVLLRTGYDSKWPDQAAYLGTDAAGGLHYPGFSAEAASWLVAERGIAALGTDTMGIDPGADTGYGANRALLHDHRIHLENLRGLGELPATGGWIVVGGVRISGGSGSPATVFGLVP